MPIPAFFKVRFEGGRGHQCREFFLPVDTLNSHASLCQALEEKLGSDLDFQAVQLQEEHPPLQLQVTDRLDYALRDSHLVQILYDRCTTAPSVLAIGALLNVCKTEGLMGQTTSWQSAGQAC